MPTFRILVAYDGTDYVGWQRQTTGTSIQGVLEDTLRAFGEGEVPVAGAGRTDAGVHALGQVASFTLARPLPCDTIVRALNARLPGDVRVRSAVDVPASFHARFDARTKTYRYRIWNGEVMPPFERRYAWHLRGPLDVGAMRCAARLIEGEHDFSAFQSAGSDVATTVRTIVGSTVNAESTDADGSMLGSMVTYEVSADGFLRHMVRSIVGTLIEIGRGRQPVDWMTDVLESRNRAIAGQTAPALGLFLARVSYHDTAEHTDTDGVRGQDRIGLP